MLKSHIFLKIVSEEPVETDSGYNTENEEEIEVETVEPSVDDSTVKTKQESKSTSGEHKRKEYMKKQKYTKVSIILPFNEF